MCTLEKEPPTENVWREKGLEKYGVIAVSGGDSGDAAQVEKVDHATAMRMLKNLGDIARVGPSLGSFSVSAKILQALCEEFKAELDAKDGKLDTGTIGMFVEYFVHLHCLINVLHSNTRSTLLDATDTTPRRIHLSHVSKGSRRL
jgi:hypothetical protein